MLKIHRSSNGGVVFILVGRIEMEHVAELRRLMSLEKANRRIVLDLKDVTLVERGVVKFLSESEADSVSLKNCPAYIREWINQDRKKQTGNEEHNDERR